MTASRGGGGLWRFLRENKWWWLTPLILIFLAVGALGVLLQRDSGAPFIYLLR